MGGAARRNNYHRAFSVQMQEAEANEQDLALHLLTTELYQLEPWKREERLERLMDKAQTDEDAKALFTALVRQGTWHVEIAGAIARRPRHGVTVGHNRAEDSQPLTTCRIAGGEYQRGTLSLCERGDGM